MVRRFRREILAKVGACKKPNRVFQLGMQLFPLSDPYPPPQRRGRKRRIRGAEIQNLSAAEDSQNESCEVACRGDADVVTNDESRKLVCMRDACTLNEPAETQGDNHEN